MTKSILFVVAFFVLVILSISSVRIFTTLFRLPDFWIKVSSIFGLIFPFVIALAMIIVRYSDGLFARIFYTKIMILTGIMFYVFLMAFALGILIFLDKFIHFQNLNWQLVSKIALCMTLLFSTVGIFQTLFLKTKNYIVADSPKSLVGKKFVLVADTHFGSINRSRKSEKTVEEIIKINPDAVLIAGDFFDGPDFDLEKTLSPWKKIAEQKNIYYAPGNHEAYGPYSKFMQELKKIGFFVLEDHYAYIDGIQIIGLKYRDKKQKEDFNIVLEKIYDKKSPAILINHAPLFQKDASKNGVFLETSGHSHKGQFWPFGYIVKMIYGKYYYGMHKYEGLTQITTSGVGTASVPFRTFNTPEIVVINFE